MLRRTCFLFCLVFLSSCTKDSITRHEIRSFIPTISIEEVSHFEGNKTSIATIRVKMSNISDKKVFLGFNTIDQAAQSEVDFVARTGTITFEPGETESSFEIEIIGDEVQENFESFEILFFSPFNATILTPSIVFNIIDDD